MQRAIKEICFAANVLDPNVHLIIYGLMGLALLFIFIFLVSIAWRVMITSSRVEDVYKSQGTILDRLSRIGD